MPQWPSSLPDSPRRDGYSKTAAQTAIRTETETGPGKARRRSTAWVSSHDVSFALIGSQKADFEAFYNDDLAGGTFKFDMPHPETGVMIRAEIMSAPIFTHRGGDAWIVSFSMRVLR